MVGSAGYESPHSRSLPLRSSLMEYRTEGDRGAWYSNNGQARGRWPWADVRGDGSLELFLGGAEILPLPGKQLHRISFYHSAHGR